MESRFDEIKKINEARSEHEDHVPSVMVRRTVQVDWEEKLWRFIKRIFGRSTK
jgi:hypothetical protein